MLTPRVHQVEHRPLSPGGVLGPAVHQPVIVQDRGPGRGQRRHHPEAGRPERPVELRRLVPTGPERGVDPAGRRQSMGAGDLNPA